METVAPAWHRWYQPRWWELVPETLLLIGLGYLFVDEMDAATSAFKSARAVALMIGAVVGWIAARPLLARFVPWPAVRLVPLLVASGAIPRIRANAATSRTVPPLISLLRER